MKRITFTVHLDVEDEDYSEHDEPRKLAELALLYGDKHQDFILNLAAGTDIAVQTLEEL